MKKVCLICNSSENLIYTKCLKPDCLPYHVFCACSQKDFKISIDGSDELEEISEAEYKLRLLLQ